MDPETLRDHLLRGACPRAARSADPWAAGAGRLANMPREWGWPGVSDDAD